MFTAPPVGATVNVGLGRLSCSRPKTPGRTSSKSRRRARPGSEARRISPAPSESVRPEFDGVTKRFVVIRDLHFHGNSVPLYAHGGMNQTLSAARRGGRSVKLLTAEARQDLAELRSFQHEHILPLLRISVLAVGDPTHHGRPDVVLRLRSEHVAGTSIADLIRTHGAFSDEGIRLYARQICSGLDYLHSNGVAHRDIRCETIMLCEDGAIKLTGWAEGGTLAHSFPRSYDTPYFLAPEVLLAETTVDDHYGHATGDSPLPQDEEDPRYADMWSVGCVCLAMIWAQPPWKRERRFHSSADFVERVQQELDKQERAPGDDREDDVSGAFYEGPPRPSDLDEMLDDFLSGLFRKHPADRLDAQKALMHHFLQSTELQQELRQEATLAPWIGEPGADERDGSSNPILLYPEFDEGGNNEAGGMLPGVERSDTLAGQQGGGHNDNDDGYYDDVDFEGSDIDGDDDADEDGEERGRTTRAAVRFVDMQDGGPDKTAHFKKTAKTTMKKTAATSPHGSPLAIGRATPIRPKSPASDRRLRKQLAESAERREHDKRVRVLAKASDANYGAWWPSPSRGDNTYGYGYSEGYDDGYDDDVEPEEEGEGGGEGHGAGPLEPLNAAGNDADHTTGAKRGQSAEALSETSPGRMPGRRRRLKEM